MGPELATAALISTALGTGLQVKAAQGQAQAQNAALTYQNQLRARGAENAQREALAAADQSRLSSRRKLSTLRAFQGARGTVGEGSPLEVLTAAAGQYEAEALDIERQGKIAQSATEARMNIANMQKASNKRAAFYNTATALTSGGTQAFQIIRGL
jgi:hypothetical protein